MQINQMTPQTRQLIGYIRNRLKEDQSQTITWDEMGAALGLRDDRNKLYGYSQTARKHILEEDGILLVADRGLGLRRERAYDKYLRAKRCHVHKTVRRANRAIPRAMEEDSEIPNEVLKETQVLLAQSGALEHFARSHATKVLAKKAAELDRKLMVGDVLKIFAGNEKPKREDVS